MYRSTLDKRERKLQGSPFKDMSLSTLEKSYRLWGSWREPGSETVVHWVTLGPAISSLAPIGPSDLVPNSGKSRTPNSGAISLFHVPLLPCKIHSHKDFGIFATVSWSPSPTPAGARRVSSTIPSLQQPLPKVGVNLTHCSSLSSKTNHPVSGTQCPVLATQILSSKS